MSKQSRDNRVLFRICIIMLSLALITMSFAFMTVAKYATTKNKTDSARVAKFGVTLAADGRSSFDNEYLSEENDGSASITVKSESGDNVVAPGTSDPEGVTFTIKGTPEVATTVKITMDITRDVFLKTGIDNMGFPTYYCPVQFTFWEGDTPLFTGPIYEVEQYVENATKDSYFPPNTDLSTTYKLTWEWDYEQDSTIDDYDTILGDLAAGLNPNDLRELIDYCIDIEYTIIVTVIQVV